MLFLIFMFIGAMMYVIGSYAHLAFAGWTFWKAYLVAMPLVAIEYQFSLRGNKWANEAGIRPINILLITLCFYFVAMYLVNSVYLKAESKSVDVLSFALIAAAFGLSFS